MENVVEKFINERITENIVLFSKEELEIIKRHKEIIKKIYILSAVNFYNC